MFKWVMCKELKPGDRMAFFQKGDLIAPLITEVRSSPAENGFVATVTVVYSDGGEQKLLPDYQVRIFTEEYQHLKEAWDGTPMPFRGE